MFDKIKNLFFVEEPDAKAKNQPAGQNKKAASPPKTLEATNNKPPAADPNYKPPTSGQPDEKFVNMLLGALDKNNLEGFDYLEYKQSLLNLGNVEMDEATKYQSALAMAKTMGATQDILLKSAQHYINVLTKEEKKFLQAFSNQQQAQVSSRNAEIKNLESAINMKTKKIEELKKEIEADTKALEKRKSTINQAAAKVAATKDRFYLAYNIVVNQIKEDVKKIQNYLK